MWFTKQSDGFRSWFTVVDDSGQLLSGVPGNIAVTVVDPNDTAMLLPSASESSVKSGLYTFLVSSSFITTMGVGEYAVVVEVNTLLFDDAFSRVLRVSQRDIDDMVTDASVVSGVWGAAAATFNTSGTMGHLQNAVATTSASLDVVRGKMLVVSGSVETIRKVETGRWLITGSRQIFFDADGSTFLAEFDLLTTSGDPYFVSGSAPVERVPV